MTLALFGDAPMNMRCHIKAMIPLLAIYSYRKGTRPNQTFVMLRIGPNNTCVDFELYEPYSRIKHLLTSGNK
jgi:hypothetical protein